MIPIHLGTSGEYKLKVYGCVDVSESWTIKKAECKKIDAFELRCWRRLLRVPWTARRSNQSILKEISSECSLEGLMLKLKLQYFGHLMRRADSFEKTLMLGKIEGRRRRGWQRMSRLDGITDSTDTSLGKLREWWQTGRPGVLRSMGSQRVRHDWATELKAPLFEGPSLWDHGPWTQNCCSVTQASWRHNLLAEVSVLYYFILSSTFFNLLFQIETSRLLL